MNALLDIQIRVQAQQALAQLRAVQGQINQLNGMATGTTAAATTGMGKFGAAIDSVSGKMVSWGKNLQWTGQQLTMSFTLPLMLAGGLATKWALENEAAFTRVRKVYSGADADLEKLRHTFELLSSRFGVNQAEVIGIGEAWAAVGAEGIALAKNVQTTMQFMILSGLDAEAATEGLIVTQAAYKLSTQELTQAIADMNAIENVTALRMGDLLEGLQKAGGAAELMGIDIRHLSAYMAALVPVTGSAATAGTALRTIFSRIFAPTPEAEEMLRIIGITATEQGKLNWHMANGEERVNMLADATRNLTDEQQAIMASVLGSRRQYNQLITLLDDVASGQGAYAKALDATADSADSNARAAKELSIFLSSQPQGFKILVTTLQNMLAKAVMPLLPALAMLLSRIVSLVKWFTELDPSTQSFIMTMLALLAALGPIVRYVGAFSSLIGVLGKIFMGAAKAAGWFFTQVLAGFAKMIVQSGVVTAKYLADLAVRTAAEVKWFIQDAARAAAWLAVWAQISLMRLSIWMNDLAARTAVEVKWFIQDAARALAWVGSWVTALGSRFAAWVADVGARTAVEIRWFLEDAARVAAWLAAWITAGAARTTALVAQGAAWVAKQAAQVATSVAIWVAGQVAMASASIAAAAASAAAWIASNPYVAAFALAIAAVVAALWAMIVFWDTDFMTSIREGITSAIEWMGDLARAPFKVVEAFTEAIGAILDGLAQFPKTVGDIMIAVLKIIQKAMMKAVDWLSYLNPFARHSPSLVENVTAGVNEILRQYTRLGRIGGLLSGVRAAHESFQAVASPTFGNATQRQFQSQRNAVASQAPSALPVFDNHVALIEKLKAELPAVEALVARQQDVVDEWADALKEANRELDAAEKLLKQYKAELESIENQIQAANQAISDLASTGITGMRKMEDAIFENEIAQKKLRLEILRIGKAFGTVDKLRDKFAKLNAEIEKMRSEREELRQAGAGSEVLAEYDAQIDALRQQQTEISKAGDQISELERQLEELRLAAEEMELEKSITFDPQLRQIEQLANGLNELPFDEIIARIKEQQAQIKLLEKAQVAANAKVADQAAVVDQLTAARDRLQEGYDAEKEKLEQIQGVYDAIRESIQLLEEDLQNFNQAIKDSTDEVSELQRMMDEAIGDFGQLADSVPEEFGSLDEFNAELQRQLDEALANMEEFDMWAPIRQKWEQFKAWFDQQLRIFEIGWNFTINYLRTTWDNGVNFIKSVFEGAMGVLARTWDTLWMLAEMRWNSFKGMLAGAWNGLQAAWSFATAPLRVTWDLLWGQATVSWRIFEGFLRGAWNSLQYTWSIVTAGFRMDWGFIWDSAQNKFQSFRNGLSTIWEGIKSVFRSAVNSIAGMIEGVINGFIGAVNSVTGGIARLTGRPGGALLSPVDLPELARGGITSGPAIVGEGRRMYPEYVIPTDPMFASTARALYDSLGRDLGITSAMSSASASPSYDHIPAASSSGDGDTVIQINGNLEFPNIKSGDDAKAFVENLKSLVN